MWAIVVEWAKSCQTAGAGKSAVSGCLEETKLSSNSSRMSSQKDFIRQIVAGFDNHNARDNSFLTLSEMLVILATDTAINSPLN